MSMILFAFHDEEKLWFPLLRDKMCYRPGDVENVEWQYTVITPRSIGLMSWVFANEYLLN